MDTLTVQVWKLDFSEFKSPAAKLVALALARRGRESGACWAKQATLATDCGVSKQTVARCLEEIEENGWLKREVRFRDDGGRTSDIIWLTLPDVTLKCSMVERKEAEALIDQVEAERATVDLRDATNRGGASSEGRDGPIRESAHKESLKESDKRSLVREEADPLPGPDIPTAVQLIWQKASKVGRGRSSKADIAAALQAALGRGHSIERILKGLGAYFASSDATKEDGAFQKGAHVMLAKDRWESFLDDAKARADVGEVTTPDQAAAEAVTGTLEEPSWELQRTWMGLYAQGLPWNPERGPAPGRIGCRVDGVLQREFGVEPWEVHPPAPPTTSDDSAAFD